MRASGMSFFLFVIVIVLSPLNAVSEQRNWKEKPISSKDEPCCGKEKFVLTPIADELESCMEEIRDLDEQQQSICDFECAGKKLELCDDEGYVKKELFVEFSKRFVNGDGTLGEFVKAMAEQMVAVVRNIPEDKRNTACNMDMILVCKGVYLKMELNCPSELQNKAPECEKLRASMRKLEEKMRV